MKTTMSIYAQALMSNTHFKSARIDGKAVGVTEARQWSTLVSSMLKPAYAVAKYDHDHMGSTDPSVKDSRPLTPLYDALRPVLALIGEVNGDKLCAENCAERVIANAMHYVITTTSDEAAHAESEKKIAKGKVRNAENAEDLAKYEAEAERWSEECKRLATLPDNYKRIPTVVTNNVFVKAIERELGDAITSQYAEDYEVVVARREAAKAKRKDRAKANKKTKRQAEAQAKSETK